MKGIVSAIADLRNGRVVTFLDEADHDALVRFASVVPELYAPDRSAWAYLAFERHRTGTRAESLEDIIIVAPPVVHVVQRLASSPDRALLTIGPWQENVGTVLGAARARLAGLEDDR